MTEDIYEELKDIWAIDTHNHVGNAFVSIDGSRSVKERLSRDLVDLLIDVYLRRELISAGMNSDFLMRLCEDKERDVDEAMKEILKYLPRIMGTTVYRALLIGLRELHGFTEDQIDESNWRSLFECVTKAYEEGVYTWWQKCFQKAKVRKALRNVRLAYFNTYRPELEPIDADIDGRLFAPTPFLDGIVSQNPQTNTVLTNLLNTRVESLSDYVEYVQKAIYYFHHNGAVGFKVGLCYYRRLDFKEVTKRDAEDIYRIPPIERTLAQQKALQDFMISEAVLASIDVGLPIQIHTGFTESILDANPAYLEPFLSRPEFADARFVLLHGGFPYLAETEIIVRRLPNVYLDLSYLPIFSYNLTRQWLTTWLEMIPINKIMVGSDVFSAEHFYGTMVLTRKLVAEVLSDMVKSKILTLEQAIEWGMLILRENAVRLYKL